MLITKIRTTMEFAKDSMGQPDNYFYVPQFAWQNPDRPSVAVYKDSKCTQVVPAEYMKYHFEELYTFEIDDKGNIVGDLAAQATPEKPTVADGIDKIIEGLQIIKQAL